MNKDQLLQELSAKIHDGEISREEVLGKLKISEEATPRSAEGGISSHMTLTKVLYVLGSAIVVIGLIIFVAQIWEDIGTLSRIIITLGLGLTMAGLGTMLIKEKPESHLGSIFHVIGGVLIPLGAGVVLSESSVEEYWLIALAYAAVFAFYLLLNRVLKNAILTFFAIANGTATVYLVVNALIDGSTTKMLYSDISRIYEYVTIALGGSYLLLANAFRGGWNKALVGVLYFFGSAGFFAAAFPRIIDSLPWTFLYFFLVIGGLFLAAQLKSRAILIVSTCALIAHVIYVTSEYFAHSLGWPISLVFLGFVFIGLGYMSITINKEYIQN